MQPRSIEIVVGAFILAGILSVAILAVRVSGFNVGSDASTYRVTAHFENVGGLVVRSKVSISGVVSGGLLTFVLTWIRSRHWLKWSLMPRLVK